MFDENVFLFCEERIIGHKMKSHGYQMVLRSDLFFKHVHGATIRKSIDIIRVQKILMQSRLYFNKYYNKCNFLAVFSLWLSTRWYLYFLQTKILLHRYFNSK